MDIAIVTGSLGLIGAESVRFLTASGLKVVGVDNNMRQKFFGDDGSTQWNRKVLEDECPSYVHYSNDIRSESDMERARWDAARVSVRFSVVRTNIACSVYI